MKNIILLCVIVIVFLLPGILLAQVCEEWVARYNGTGNYHDLAQEIALDSSGNVYVTGFSYGVGTEYDYATVKYDTNGNVLWVARYNGPANLNDRPYAIAVDSDGNIYVTGTTQVNIYDYDYATIKYDANGNELWVVRYNGPMNAEDHANAIAIDVFGNVYVTGTAYFSWMNTSYATLKYDSNGNELWVARYDGPGNIYSNSDNAGAIAVDVSGNIYVTGGSAGTIETLDDYATVKYDTNGNELWIARYNGPAIGNNYDLATAIVVDSSSNVYITGESIGAGTNWDYATVSYDSFGNQRWVTRYNGTGNNYDFASAIVIVSSGDVCVTGRSVGTGTSYDYATIRYDGNGNELWVKRYNGLANEADGATAVAIDSSGNVYVTGYSGGLIPGGTLTTIDYATIKYDPNGNEIWVVKYNVSANGPATNWNVANAIVVDLSSNVYVTGTSSGYAFKTWNDYATIKYLQSQNQPPVLISNIPDEIWLYNTSNANAFDLDNYFYDTDGDILTYTVSWSYYINVFIDSENIVSFTQPWGWYGTECVVFTANDGCDGIANSNIVTLIVQPNTPIGSNVNVDLGSGVTVTFSSVTVAGDTTLTITDTGPPPSAGFKLAGNYYEIITTALYTGPIIAEIIYDDTGMTAGQEKTLKLFHLESGVWVNVTTSLDTVNNIITGEVANLSLFAVMFESGPPGWDEGNKTGWQDETPSGLIKNDNTPDGFDKGRKSGWEK